MQTGLLSISMTLAIVLTLGSLLAGTSGAAGSLPWPTSLQEQQSNTAKAPAQAQDQGPQQQENKQEPPQAAPSQEAEKPALPEAGNAQTNQNPPSAEKPAEEPAAGTKPDEAQTPAPKGKRKKMPAKPTSGPKKIVVRDGGTAEPTTQLTPGMPHDQVTHSRQTTTWLLSSTQDNLKRASARLLNTSQQATVQQIKLFVDQANAAMKQGDFQRGHNLAMKAHLLSDDLLKH
jgi:hypothetical protein